MRSRADGDGAMEDFSRRSEAYGAVAALEQPDADLVLQLRDVAADGGLVGPQFLGGTVEARMARGGVERTQGVHPRKRSIGIF